jgi:hypothetical protein
MFNFFSYAALLAFRERIPMSSRMARIASSAPRM